MTDSNLYTDGTKEIVLGLIDRGIQRWREIVFSGACDDECPLCTLFSFSDCSDGNDVLCPIAEMTGVDGCWGTPFYTWREFLPHDPEIKIHANHMLSFLYSVRLFWIIKMNRG